MKSYKEGKAGSVAGLGITLCVSSHTSYYIPRVAQSLLGSKLSYLVSDGLSAQFGTEF